MPEIPDSITKTLMSSLSDVADLVETWCLRGEIPESRVKLLLAHEDPTIANAAAYGEFNCDPAKSVRESLQDDWRAAVIRCNNDKHRWLHEALSSDATMGFEWLQERMADSPENLYRMSDATAAAVNGIDREQRKSLLDDLASEYHLLKIAQQLVGNDPDLYKSLLANPKLKALHLGPLRGNTSDTGLQMAVIALDAGYDPEAIAFEMYRMDHAWRGSEARMWASIGRRFEPLVSHADARIREVGNIGLGWASAQQGSAAARERSEAIHGRS
ncbi:MAG: hypothetical protein IID37_08560 [Planctomycetes bacterium]|nr:hypothetical protein [Planctomycetota bacterium]